MIIPVNVSLTDWASSLIIDFPDSSIPALKSEEDWKGWGNTLVERNVFAENGAPSTHHFSDWQSWAKMVFFTMANF